MRVFGQERLPGIETNNNTITKNLLRQKILTVNRMEMYTDVHSLICLGHLSCTLRRSNIWPIYFMQIFMIEINVISLESEKGFCHDANFVVTAGTGGCHDNLRYHQWRQSWHHDNYRVSVNDKVGIVTTVVFPVMTKLASLEFHSQQSWHHENSRVSLNDKVGIMAAIVFPVTTKLTSWHLSISNHHKVGIMTTLRIQWI